MRRTVWVEASVVRPALRDDWAVVPAELPPWVAQFRLAGFRLA